MMVLLLPPRAFCRSLVSTESRYGTENTKQQLHSAPAFQKSLKYFISIYTVMFIVHKCYKYNASLDYSYERKLSVLRVKVSLKFVHNYNTIHILLNIRTVVFNFTIDDFA